MSENEYRKLLEAHDWYYEFSDDHSVYKLGRVMQFKLRQLALSDKRLMQMYEDKLFEMRKR
jgi:hypothetical protein